jgi:hypothetical protein
MPYLGAAIVAAITASFLVTTSPFLTFILALGALSVVSAAHKPDLLASMLIIFALPLMRPNIMGEKYSIYAFGLSIIGALIAAIHDGRQAQLSRPFLTVFMLTILMYLWTGISQALAGTYLTLTGWGKVHSYAGLESSLPDSAPRSGSVHYSLDGHLYS